ncbi:MAG: PhoU domain-containing protein [Thermoplasmata archaeon]
MEIRKVQKTGGSTFIVSLPKDWILKNNINEGDLLSIIENEGGNLIIGKELSERHEQKEIVLNVQNEKEDLILRKLIAIYLSGFNTIRISAEFLSDDIKNAIKKFTTLSLGVEIIEETNKYVLIQDLSRFSDFLMEKIFQRLYIMTENMVNDTKNLILNFDKTLALDIIDRDMQIDRVFWLISKQFYMALKNNNILKDQGIDITRAFNLRSIAKLFERIGDHSVSISYVALENKIINGNELLPYFDETIEIFRNSYKSYKNLDVESANSEIEKSHIFSKKARELLKNLERKKIKDIVGISSIVESLIRIAMYSADLAEITIDEKMSNF